jgi:hypothetical protein
MDRWKWVVEVPAVVEPVGAVWEGAAGVGLAPAVARGPKEGELVPVGARAGVPAAVAVALVLVLVAAKAGAAVVALEPAAAAGTWAVAV